jgi:hypothetical protein
MTNNFDYSFYIYINNLNQEIINNEEKALEDYELNKKDRIFELERSKIKELDPIIYLLCNKDLFDKNIITKKDAEFHYYKHGINENRIKNLKDLEKILPDFNWIEYLYIHKYLFDELNNKKKCYIHYLLFNFGKKYNTMKHISKDFNFNFYINYYSDLKNKYKNSDKALNHYIFYGINENRNEWFFIYERLLDLNIKHYLIENPDLNRYNKNELMLHWYKYGSKEERIFIPTASIDYKELSTLGIAVSIYSDIYTPNERLSASFICLNYLALMMNNCKIIFLIDGNILKNHLDYILKLKKFNKNIKIYKNKQNYGIAKTKNICLSLLNKDKSLDYYCLLDDDILIKQNFYEYIDQIFKEIDISLLTNYNKGLPYFLNQFKQDYLVKSSYFLGNIVIISRKYFNKLGYLQKFKYRWGEEHVEFTKRYLNNTKYRNTTVDFRKYLEDSFKINNKDTLHLHSFDFQERKADNNTSEYLKYIQLNEYVNFNFNENEIQQL